MQINTNASIFLVSGRKSDTPEVYEYSPVNDPTMEIFRKLNVATYAMQKLKLTLVPGIKNSQRNINGEMPMKRRFGYVKDISEDGFIRTIAHELGHGNFQLYHTFSPKYNIPEGTTENLMDAHNPTRTKLTKFQWDAMHDPALKLNVFVDDEEVESAIVLMRENEIVTNMLGKKNLLI